MSNTSNNPDRYPEFPSLVAPEEFAAIALAPEFEDSIRRVITRTEANYKNLPDVHRYDINAWEKTQFQTLHQIDEAESAESVVEGIYDYFSAGLLLPPSYNPFDFNRRSRHSQRSVYFMSYFAGLARHLDARVESMPRNEMQEIEQGLGRAIETVRAIPSKRYDYTGTHEVAERALHLTSAISDFRGELSVFRSLSSFTYRATADEQTRLRGYRNPRAVEEYLDLLRAHSDGETRGRKTLDRLTHEGTELIMQTLDQAGTDFAVPNAKKLYEQLEKERTPIAEGTGAKVVTFSALIGLANMVTPVINRSLDGSAEPLENLPLQVVALPEAFRRIMYTVFNGSEADNEITEAMMLPIRFSAIDELVEIISKESGQRQRAGRVALGGANKGRGKLPNKGHTFWNKWRPGYGVIQ